MIKLFKCTFIHLIICTYSNRYSVC